MGKLSSKRIGSIAIEDLEEENLTQSKTDNQNAFEHLEEGEEKVDGKHYLPVLNINDESMWESKPNSQREHLTDEKAYEVCMKNCCGVPGLFAACCRMDPDDLEHVLGPVDEDWIKKTIKQWKKQGYEITRSDLVIDYEEGKIIGDKLFNGNDIFKNPSCYPILRFKVHGQRYACQFMNPDNGLCRLYGEGSNDKRPGFCKTYYCEYIKKNFLVRRNNNSNKWEKIK